MKQLAAFDQFLMRLDVVLGDIDARRSWVVRLGLAQLLQGHLPFAREIPVDEHFRGVGQPGATGHRQRPAAHEKLAPSFHALVSNILMGKPWFLALSAPEQPKQMANFPWEFAICFGCSGALKAKNQGLPIEMFDTSAWKEGASFSVGGGTLTMPSQAPHPNAAKVFINWYLSRRGQIALQKLGDPDEPPNSARIDIPKDDVQAHQKLVEGRKYFDANRPEFEDVESAFKIAIQALDGR